MFFCQVVGMNNIKLKQIDTVQLIHSVYRLLILNTSTQLFREYHTFIFIK